MRIAPQVVLSPEQRVRLEAYARGRSLPARLVLRAKIVLLAAEGLQDLAIARQLQVVPRTVARWRARFLALGIPGLQQDSPRPGRPRQIDDSAVRQVVAKTTREKPPEPSQLGTSDPVKCFGISRGY